VTTDRRHSRKLKRNTYRPLLEQMEDRRLLATWTVDDNFVGAACTAPQRRCETIQEAVDAARAGDTINVKAGRYEENVTVDKKLTIQGNNKPTVDPVDDGVLGVPSYGFNLQANDIVLKGFRIGDFDADAGADRSVGINTSSLFSGYKIQNNLIQENVFGIYLNTSTSNSARPTGVTGNTIRANNVGTGVLPAAGNGIYSDQGARKVNITNNTFIGHNNEDVIFVAPAALQNALNVSKNTLKDSSGIFFVNVQNSKIEHNKIVRSNFNAIELAGGNVGISIRGNNLQQVGIQGFTGIYLNSAIVASGNFNTTIVGNTVNYAGLSGIRVRDSAFNLVKGNVVIGSKGFDLDPMQQNWGNGINLENATSNKVESNTTKLNARHGIYVDSLSSENVIKNNFSFQNRQGDPAGFDYFDDSNGDGTAGTDQRYDDNTGRTQNRPGLIRFKI
jgi:parallel beta-helix repeat protein